MVKWKKSSGLIVLVAVVITVISAVPHKSFDSDNVELDDIKPFSDDGRLPKDVVPVHYDLQLTTNVHNNGNRAITGFVKILVKILTETNRIVLHNRGLNINYVNLLTENGANSIQVNYTTDSSRDFLIIVPVNAQVVLPAGNEFYIEIKFTGNLRTDMGGFYRSLYYVKGETLPR
jgi:aminopeptidase N